MVFKQIRAKLIAQYSAEEDTPSKVSKKMNLKPDWK